MKMDTGDILLLIACGMVANIIGISIGESIHKTASVEHGCAYYHPQTSEFTWVEKSR